MKVKNRNFTSLASHSLTRLQWRGSANPLQYKHVTHNTEIYRCSSQKHVTHYTELIKWETCYTLHWIDQVRNMLHITLNWSSQKHVTHYTELIKWETCYTLHLIDQVRNMLHITLNWSSEKHVTHYTEIDQVRNMLHITLNWSSEKHVTHYTQLIKSETETLCFPTFDFTTPLYIYI